MAQKVEREAVEPETYYPEKTVPYYSNRVQLFIGNVDVVMDFLMTEPALPGKEPKAVFQSRIIMSPQHAKQFSEILAQNMAKYEEVFGPLSIEPIK
jgi:hypothetical protein